MTDKGALTELYEKMQSEMPAVAGVCQGASKYKYSCICLHSTMLLSFSLLMFVQVILEDTAIRNMSLETLSKVTRPKVEGSLHLDQLIQSSGLDLEFFIFFSSLASIIGRVGQGNYAAANLFMSALAEQRRQRGHAASVMHIGPILGVGYIHEQGLDLGFNTAVNQRMSPLCEQDFCQQFAEAILAGRFRSPWHTSELISGLARFESLDEDLPLLSHFIKDPDGAVASTNGETSTVPLKVKLEGAEDRDQVVMIVQEALLIKLSALFQMPLDELEQTDLKTLRLDDLGIDSLIAVELRGFFVNTLQVNIPVLKILNGAIIADLVENAVEMIPRRLVPNMEHRDEFPSTAKAEAAQTRVSAVAKQLHPSQQQSISSVRSHSVDKSAELPQHLPSMNLANSTDSSSDLEDKSTTTTSEQHLEQDLKSKNCFSLQTVQIEELAPISSDSSQYEIAWLPKSPHTLPTTPGSQPDETKQVHDLTLTAVDDKVLGLSFSQSLFWFSAAITNDPTSLNLTGTFRLDGNLDVERLKNAVLALGQQHESLRTRFFVQNDKPMQGVMSRSSLHLDQASVRSDSDVIAYAKRVHKHVYSLDQGDTVRLVLLSRSETHHFFVIGVHHLAMDGQSFYPFMNDLMRHYTGALHGNAAIQYTDYTAMQHREAETKDFVKGLAFWKTELAQLPPALPIMRNSTHISRPKLMVLETPVRCGWLAICVDD